MFENKLRLPDAAPKAEWKVWYQDTFDRSAPRRVEAEGKGLTAGPGRTLGASSLRDRSGGRHAGIFALRSLVDAGE